MKSFSKAIILLWVLVVLGGCSTLPPEASLTREELIEQRAQARWNHLVAGEAESAWSYYSPGYRSITSAADFDGWLRNRPVRWLSAEVNSVSCAEPARCSVQTSVSYQVPTAPTGINQMRMTRDVEEDWVLLDGEWFYLEN